MKLVVAMLLLALASIAPARAATCPQEVQLRADPRWAPRDGENCHHCSFNIVGVGPGALMRWNGVATTEATLARYLGLIAPMQPPPVTLLRIEARADCALLARTVAAIERHAGCGADEICTFGLARNFRPRR